MCEVCGKVLSTAGSLAVHKAKFCKVKQYKCDKCDKRFKFKRNFESHTDDHFKVGNEKNWFEVNLSFCLKLSNTNVEFAS